MARTRIKSQPLKGIKVKTSFHNQPTQPRRQEGNKGQDEGVPPDKKRRLHERE